MIQVTRLTLEEDGGHGRTRLKETTTNLDAPLETVGQDLRSARLKRGEDLAAVSRVLKIRKEHLDALEEDKIELLPGRTYAVGFIRSYAMYLGLDPVAFVDRFKAEIAGRNDMSPPPVAVLDEDERKKLPQGWWAIAGVVLLLVLYGAYQLMAAADRAMREQVSEPPPVETAMPAPIKPPVKAPPVTPPPDADAGADAEVSPGLTQQAAPGSLSPALNATGAGTVTGTAARPAAVQTQPPPLPQGQIYGAMNKNARVVLRAVQPTRVLVENASGKIFILKALKPGDIYQVPNLAGLKLTADNANALDITLDGQSVGRVGRTSETVEAVPLDPQAIMNRYRR
jgi:cytoskeleton protein RodZ